MACEASIFSAQAILYYRGVLSAVCRLRILRVVVVDVET